MSEIPALLDRLKEWIVAYDPTGKTYGHFAHDMATAHSELATHLSDGSMSDDELQSYQVIMSLADARGLLLPDDGSENLLIRGDSTPP